jgi:aspartate 1-decarboxylase
MQRQMLKSKIHRAKITTRDPDYVGTSPELVLS